MEQDSTLWLVHRRGQVARPLVANPARIAVSVKQGAKRGLTLCVYGLINTAGGRCRVSVAL